MVYLLFYSWGVATLFLYDRLHFSRISAFLLLAFFVFVIAFLPSFQFGVGTDYFTYSEIFEGTKSVELFFRKGEFAFYYIVVWLRQLGLPAQSLFLVISLLSSVLVALSLNVFRVNGYKTWAIFLLMVLVTGMLHNQMNGLRNYVAVYCFVLAILCKFDGRYVLGLMLSILGVFFHQTMYAMIFFVLVPTSVYRFFSRNVIAFYTGFFLFWLSGVPIQILDYLLHSYMGFYSHYSDLLNSPSSFFNIASKMYYIPFHLWFIVWLRRNYYNLSRFSANVIGFWVLGSSVYLGLIYSGLIFRVWHYFVFFSVIPIYYFFYSREADGLKYLALAYVVFPYLVKVIVFPVGEYDYSFYLFN